MAAYRKVVVIGDVGAGKSTLIRTLSEIRAIDTDRKSTVDIGKEMTTVGIDYGRINLESDLAIGLYGVPGQQRFSALWTQVRRGAWGLIVLKRFNDSAGTDDLEPILDAFAECLEKRPFVVGITHVEDVSGEDVEAVAGRIRLQLEQRNLPGIVISVDCREQRSSLAPLVLLNSLDDERDS